MTPEREKYLAACSKREMTLRRLIKCFKAVDVFFGKGEVNG